MLEVYAESSDRMKLKLNGMDAPSKKLEAAMVEIIMDKVQYQYRTRNIHIFVVIPDWFHTKQYKNLVHSLTVTSVTNNPNNSYDIWDLV